MNSKQELFTLAEQGLFDALSPEEQSLVLQSMSQEYFDEWHQSIQASQAFFKQQKTEVDYAVKYNLDQAFRMKYAGKRSPWIQRTVPLWQAAAACFLVALLSWAFLDASETEKITETIYIYQTDTIFQDAPIVNESPQEQARSMLKTTPKNFPVISKQKQKPNQQAEVISVNFELERMPKVNDSVVVFQNRMGQSVKDDTLLMNWGGVIF
ncbi:MAG: hypothetical protein AAF806_08320 [Bacteroidota bacterium]